MDGGGCWVAGGAGGGGALPSIPASGISCGLSQKSRGAWRYWLAAAAVEKYSFWPFLKARLGVVAEMLRPLPVTGQRALELLPCGGPMRHTEAAVAGSTAASTGAACSAAVGDGAA